MFSLYKEVPSRGAPPNLPNGSKSGKRSSVVMRRNLLETRAKVRQGGVKKRCAKMVAAAVKQNNRHAASIRKGLEKADKAIGKFKQEAARGNTQAMRNRIGKRRSNYADAKARVQKSLLAELRRGV